MYLTYQNIRDFRVSIALTWLYARISRLDEPAASVVIGEKRIKRYEFDGFEEARRGFSSLRGKGGVREKKKEKGEPRKRKSEREGEPCDI